MSHHPPRWPAVARPFPTALAALVVALVPTLARADVEWHPDLDTAQAASRISHRPVLAVFVASWGTGAGGSELACLRSPEAEAVLATCFEPVRIDIDEHDELTRAAGITHVPAACVLAADGTAQDRFEMPGSPAAFVKKAILAAQRSTARDLGVNAGDAGGESPLRRERPAPEPSAITETAFGSGADAEADSGRPARGSLSRVAAKVRDLSAFAAAEVPAVAAPMAIARASRTVDEKPTGYEPIAWPAESATTPAATLAAAPTIEPAATALTPSTVAPWLDAPPARPAATTPPVAPQQPPATAAAALPPPEQPAARPEPAQSGLLATLQKPFALFGKQAADPPTLPPAHPRSPLAGPAPAASAPAVAAATEPAPDTHGSMPLGLEGYCPVTLVDRGAWTEGRAQWGARHRGRTYLFAGPEEQRTFLSNPDRYAPALSGDDPVLALDRGSSTPGQRRYGVTYQARIYLFATPESRQAFTTDPARYVGRIAVAERPAPAAAGGRLY